MCAPQTTLLRLEESSQLIKSPPSPTCANQLMPTASAFLFFRPPLRRWIRRTLHFTQEPATQTRNIDKIFILARPEKLAVVSGCGGVGVLVRLISERTAENPKEALFLFVFFFFFFFFFPDGFPRRTLILSADWNLRSQRALASLLCLSLFSFLSLSFSVFLLSIYFPFLCCVFSTVQVSWTLWRC